MDSLKPLEVILARFTPRDRAASILGDLTELSATRGRVWFYATYTRTLIALAWRTPVAFLIAVAGVWLSFRNIVFMRLFLWLRHVYIGHFGGYKLPVFVNSEWIPLRTQIAYRIVFSEHFLLFFALPFALLRFGGRSRITHLTFAFAMGLMVLIALPIYSRSPMLMDLTVLFAIAAALLLPLWRRPMIVLAAAYVAFYAPIEIYFRLLLPTLFRIGFTDHYYVCYYMGLALAAIVCVYLYRPSPNPAIEMTATSGT
jgi:hypothetical protein